MRKIKNAQLAKMLFYLLSTTFSTNCFFCPNQILASEIEASDYSISIWDMVNTDDRNAKSESNNKRVKDEYNNIKQRNKQNNNKNTDINKEKITTPPSPQKRPHKSSVTKADDAPAPDLTIPNPVKNLQQQGKITGLPLPRFASLKANEVNVRVGPGSQYYIKHIYRCRTYPVEIIDEFDNWRLISDSESNQGWVHENLLSSKPYIIIINKSLSDNRQKNNNESNKFSQNNSKIADFGPYAKPSIPAFRLPDEKSKITAILEIGAIVVPKKCINAWCKVSASDINNIWIKKEHLWGDLRTDKQF